MTLRQSIIDYLKTKHGFINSQELHKKMVEAGYSHSRSCGEVSKLAKDGQLLKKGKSSQSQVALNRRYKLTEKQKRKIESHAHLAKDVKGRRVSEGNRIFDICRNKSRIYNLIDTPLMAIRS